MNRSPLKNTLKPTLLLLSCIACSCADAGAGTADMPPSSIGVAAHNMLRLVSADRGAALALERGPRAPRVVEAFVQLSPNLRLVKSEVGEAAAAAQKQLVVQDKGEGLIRIVLYAAGNTLTLESGVLAELELQHLDAAPARVELVRERTALAPAEANGGLTLGEALKL